MHNDHCLLVLDLLSRLERVLSFLYSEGFGEILGQARERNGGESVRENLAEVECPDNWNLSIFFSCSSLLMLLYDYRACKAF